MIFASKAPEFENIKAWINTKPLSLDGLAGKIVLLDFWTYSCINCVRTLPHMKALHATYAPHGLVLIGVHTPEFDFEKIPENVQKAVAKHKIPYPVALDSDNTTWRLYGNQYWPRQTLIDRGRRVRYEHVGEGGYDEIETEIRNALQDAGVVVEKIKKISTGKKSPSPFQRISPETYAGKFRNQGIGSHAVCTPEGCDSYVDPGNHTENVIYLQGEWAQLREFLQHVGSKPAHVVFKYRAKQANMVLLPANKPVEAEVLLDDKPLSKANAGKDIIFKNGKSFVRVNVADVYEIVSTKEIEQHEVKLVTTSERFSLYAYTFG